MIKLNGMRNGRPFVLLGLSEGNIQKLKEGKPINVWAEELGISHDIGIMWGETEQKMIDEIKALGIELPEPKIEGKN